MISRLQYISQGTGIAEHLQNIQLACEAGCDWVQLRLKNVSDEEYLKAALEARQITSSHKAVFIVNDHLNVALDARADGCHLGRGDMDLAKARKMVKDGFVLGGSTNSLEHIIQAEKAGADYVGLGPFRFTSTKDNLNPILRLEGMKQIMELYHALGLQIPVFAIGGIAMQDADALAQIGLYGVAVSGAVTYAEEKALVVKRLKTVFDR
jgi:thiamine-phosphate pyrophosphorylase